MQESRWLYQRRDIAEAQRDLTAWLGRWSAKYPKLADRVEENVGETFAQLDIHN